MTLPIDLTRIRSAFSTLKGCGCTKRAGSSVVGRRGGSGQRAVGWLSAFQNLLLEGEVYLRKVPACAMTLMAHAGFVLHAGGKAY